MFFAESKQFKKKRGGVYSPRNLRTPERLTKPIDFMTLAELWKAVGDEFTCDTECYHNFWFAAFKHKKTGKIISVELSPDQSLDKDVLGWLLFGAQLVTFNGNRYDMLMTFGAMSGLNNESLKELSDFIIKENATAYDVSKRYGFRVPRHINHIDLIEVAPVSKDGLGNRTSLKTYAGRFHCERMQDLPIDPDKYLTADEAMTIRHYCVNDLDNTEGLRNELTPHIELREKLSKEFETDLRSLSDAQMAEVIYCREFHRITGVWPKRPGFEPGSTFTYKAPSYVKFRSKELQDLLKSFESATFVVGDSGHVLKPQELDERKVTISGRVYSVGLGGLHSNEKSQTVKADENYLVIDRDVTGYYPNLILKNGFFPKHLGPEFLTTLQAIVDKRYKAKKAGDDVTASSLKIASNGIFGKLSDPYSTCYDPQQMVATTLTGQLSLLMAIEYLEEIGFRVVSANTDGIVTHIHRSRYAEFKEVFRMWEQFTGLETEECMYDMLCSRDVNNYIAVKCPEVPNLYGGTKAKGVYTEKGSALNSRLSKNPAALVTADAVRSFLERGKSIEKHIRECTDVRRFVSVIKVKGGAHKDGEYLGKVVRFYYSDEVRGTINYVDTNNSVPNSEDARPAMDLPKSIPDDLNYQWYIDKANKTLSDIGFIPKPKQEALFVD